MSLVLDKEKLSKELLKNLEFELGYACEAWKNEALNGVQHPYFKSGADATYEIKKTTEKIIVYLKANTFLLADSYGTGSLMLTDENPRL